MSPRIDIKKISFEQYLHSTVPLLVLLVFLIVTLYAAILPSVENYMLESRRHESRELVRAVWSTADGLYQQVLQGTYSEAEAKNIIIGHVNSLRFGSDMKSYCWIHDVESNLLAHPYSSTMNLGEYTDKTGLRVVPSMNQIVDAQGEGFLEYYWQWNDDSVQQEKKTSFVKAFEPWGWVIGSGFYEKEVADELKRITQPILFKSFIVIGVVTLILLFSLHRSLRSLRSVVEKEIEIQNLSEIIRKSPLSIVVTDLKGNIQYVNPHTTKNYGWSEEELKSSNVRAFKSGFVDRAVYKDLWETILSGEIWKGEMLNKNKRDELIWEDVLISPIKDKQGNITQFYAIKQDISEQKKLEHSLLNAKIKAEESDQLKSNFLNNFSHEIRTPLNAIFGFSNSLKDDLSISQEAIEHIEIIEENSGILLEIVNKILRLSQLETQKDPVEFRKCNIDELLEEVAQRVLNKHTASGRSNLQFFTEYDARLEDKSVYTNELLLTEVLENLFENAFKFTDSGHLKFGYNYEDGEIKIFVQDTGCGIQQNEMIHIFKKFYQGKTKFVSLHEGVGLGLSISDRIASLLNGSISVESKESEGSCFYLNKCCIPEKQYQKSSFPVDDTH